METFEDRKRNYLNGLNEHIDILVSLVNKEHNKMTEIILDPKNDGELMVANATIQMIIDMKELVENIEDGMVKPIDMKSSYVVNLFIRIIKALMSRNQEEVNNCYLELKDTNIKDAAKLIYEMMVVFVVDPDKTIEYIANESGFNIDNEVDAARFQLYLQKANEITNKKKAIDTENIDANDEMQINEYVAFTNELHKLCEEGKINPKDTDHYSSRLRRRYF